MIVRPGPHFRDMLFRFTGIPCIALMSHIIFFNEKNGISDSGFSFWEVVFISIVEAMALWEVNRLILIYFRKRLPDLQQSVKRILLQLLFCLLATVVVRYLNVWLYDFTLFWGYRFTLEAYVYNIFVGLLYVFIIAGVYEGLYYFQQWKKLFEETEALKRENLQSQLESLKTQISPHFLFNNLSSLASLIMEDQQQAVKFVKGLSDVYRYLLQANEKDLITVREEMIFCNQYFKLLKTRFGDAINFEVDVDKNSIALLLPPLTLQILLENAIKHNATFANHPLNIRLHAKEKFTLIMENNIQKRNSPVISHGTGLKNLKRKFEILNNNSLQIETDHSTFKVFIPLITPEYENISC